MKKTLTDYLSGVLNAATANPGKYKFVDLPRGLRVGYKVDDDGTNYLYLSRPDVSPSNEELETVLKYWPGESPTIGDPIKKPFADRFWIYAEVEP